MTTGGIRKEPNNLAYAGYPEKETQRNSVHLAYPCRRAAGHVQFEH